MKIIYLLGLVFIFASCSSPRKINCKNNYCTSDYSKFKIHHAKNITKDAEDIGKKLASGISDISKYFQKKDIEYYSSQIPLIIDLKSKRTENVDEGKAIIHTDFVNNAYTARLELFAFSKFKKGTRSRMGHFHDKDTYYKVLIHEYSSALIDIITKKKRKDGILEALLNGLCKAIQNILVLIFHLKRINLFIRKEYTSLLPEHLIKTEKCHTSEEHQKYYFYMINMPKKKSLILSKAKT